MLGRLQNLFLFVASGALVEKERTGMKDIQSK
jgi:hypothetical protein